MNKGKNQKASSKYIDNSKIMDSNMSGKSEFVSEDDDIARSRAKTGTNSSDLDNANEIEMVNKNK